jgi:esterase/lipase superfamily enzyme
MGTRISPLLLAVVGVLGFSITPLLPGAGATAPMLGDGPRAALEVRGLNLRIQFQGPQVADRIELRVHDPRGRLIHRGTVSAARLADLDLGTLRISGGGRYTLLLRDEFHREAEVVLEVSETPAGLAVTTPQQAVMEELPATAPPPPPPPPPATTPPPVTAPDEIEWQRLFFSTDRKLVPHEENLEKRFGADRADGGGVSHGIAMVSFPPGHKRGRLERPFGWVLWTRVNPDKHVTLQSLELARPDSFFTKLDRELQASDGTLLVTIHGYRVKFGDAVLLGAQFAHDIGIPSAAYLFTWPSKGGFTDYSADEATNEWSRGHFAAVLDTLVRLPSARRVMVVAHSMGARIAAGAITQLRREGRLTDEVQVSELVLAAADLDAPLFVENWPHLRGGVRRTTIYCSSNDAAMHGTRMIHGKPRVGDGGERALVLDGLDTIDASESYVDMFAHGYFANDSSVVGDLADVLAGKPPTVRCCARAACCLEPATKDGKAYWRYRN